MRAVFLLSLTFMIGLLTSGSAAEPVSFESDIRPILAAKCFRCHSDQTTRPKMGLRLDTLEHVLAGSRNGPAVIAGSPEKSELFKLATLPEDDEDVMPPPDEEEEHLTPAELDLLREWITSSPETTKSGNARVPEVDFEKEILPVLRQRCFSCHSAKRKDPKAELRMDTPEDFLKGSKNGAIVVAGKPDESPILQRISKPGGDEDIMPPKGDPLTAAQIDRIRIWIGEGAEFGEWGKRPAKAPTLDFEKEILPIFRASCFRCHSPESRRGPRAGLRLDELDLVLKGSKAGPVIVPGKPEESTLYKLITLPEDDPDLMPSEGKPLSPEQTKKIHNWILELGDAN